MAQLFNRLLLINNKGRSIMSKINKLFAIFLSTLLVTFSANSVEVKFGHVGKPGSLFSASVRSSRTKRYYPPRHKECARLC